MKLLDLVTLLQPALKRRQNENRPSFIQRIARQQLESDGIMIEPDLKRRRSTGVVPLDKPDSVAKLPELPDDLKHKQVRPEPTCNSPRACRPICRKLISEKEASSV